MSKILYAVIALRKDEVNQVITELQARGMGQIAEWLATRKDSLYGSRSDDWRPFNMQTIDQILNSDKKEFLSQTKLINALDNNFSNLDMILDAGIAIYFIDPFALFLKRYKDLATRLDALLANSEKCCFILPFGLSDDSEALLSQACSEPWRMVFTYYTKGFLHRIALRSPDLINLRNYWLRRVKSGPNPTLSSQASALLGKDYPTNVPRNISN